MKTKIKKSKIFTKSPIAGNRLKNYSVLRKLGFSEDQSLALTKSPEDGLFLGFEDSINQIRLAGRPNDQIKLKVTSFSHYGILSEAECELEAAKLIKRLTPPPGYERIHDEVDAYTNIQTHVRVRSVFKKLPATKAAAKS